MTPSTLAPVGCDRSDEAVKGLPTGIERLDALAESMTRAGLPTRVSIASQALSLAPAVDHAAYNIAVEALTNALRHAVPASAVVSLTDLGEHLILDVINTGRGRVANHSYGTAGMRDWAMAVGGELEAGPGPLGGFRARARLPVGGIAGGVT